MVTMEWEISLLLWSVREAAGWSKATLSAFFACLPWGLKEAYGDGSDDDNEDDNEDDSEEVSLPPKKRAKLSDSPPSSPEIICLDDGD